MQPSSSDNALLFKELEQVLRKAKDAGTLYQAIVDAPFEHKLEMALLFLGFICFFQVDEGKKVSRLIAFADTEHYRMSVEGFEFDPYKYQVPLSDTANTITKAIVSNQPSNTTDWGSLSRKQTPADVARLNQANSGIADSILYPVKSKKRGALMFNYFQYQEAIGPQQNDFMKRYTALVSSLLQD